VLCSELRDNQRAAAGAAGHAAQAGGGAAAGVGGGAGAWRRLRGVAAVDAVLVPGAAGHGAPQLRAQRRGAHARAPAAAAGAARARAAAAGGAGVGGVLPQGAVPAARQAARGHRAAERCRARRGDAHARVRARRQGLPAALDHARAPLHLHRPLAHHPRLHGQVHALGQERPLGKTALFGEGPSAKFLLQVFE